MFYESFNSGDHRDFEFVAIDCLYFPAHLHRNFELIIVTEGEHISHVDGKEYHVRAGQALLVFPYQIHTYDYSENMKGRMLLFPPSFVPQFMKKHRDVLPVSNVFTYTCGIDIDFKNNFFRRISYLYEVLGEFMEQAEFVPRSSVGSSDLAVRMLDYANEHFRENCSLQNLAQHLNYSYTYISKYFKTTIGMEFTRYVNTLRLEYASNLLKNPGSQSISSIAFESGFSSLCTFNREFRRQFGCSPSDYIATQDKEA